jgi:hypothetical protein
VEAVLVVLQPPLVLVVEVRATTEREGLVLLEKYG